MSGVWGNNIKFSIFGESHGNAIGGVISSLPSGFEIDFDAIDRELVRRNHRAIYSTNRAEPDKYEILSGVFNGKTNGAPLAFMIKNSDTHSSHYDDIKDNMRPGHADYTAFVKYGGFADYRGGGHFSGRITAPLVVAGAIAKQILEKQYGINVYSHIKRISDINMPSVLDIENGIDELEKTKAQKFPIIDESKRDEIMAKIEKSREEGDSLGGVIECVIAGVEAGVGEPFFDSVESRISQMMFSIPAVKGVEFGRGFDIAKLTGFDVNDSFRYEGEKVVTSTNNNGGINGGITNGMPIVFGVAVKPTPSIFKEQKTINVNTKENVDFTLKGRHDVCIVPRAACVVECASALVMLDFLGGK